MRKVSLGLLLVAAAMTASCGSGSRSVVPTAAVGGSAGSRPPSGQSPRGQAHGRKADPARLAVIQGWSRSLRSGDVRGAARYFAVPSLLINGRAPDGEPYVTAIRSFNQAVNANASLPCGAELISAVQYGRYVNALFRLTDRPGVGGGCGAGVGGTARTNFLIKRGRIVEWIRGPTRPGENGRSGAGGVLPQV